MPYTIGYSPRRVGGKVSETTLPDARQALKTLHDLQASDETIRYIKAPGVARSGRANWKWKQSENPSRRFPLKKGLVDLLKPVV